MLTLDTFRPRESGKVVGVQGEGAIQQRLLEMGVVDGADVEVVRYAPLGDPMEIFVRGFHLTLRKSEAAFVEMQR